MMIAEEEHPQSGFVRYQDLSKIAAASSLGGHRGDKDVEGVVKRIAGFNCYNVAKNRNNWRQLPETIMSLCKGKVKEIDII